MAMPSDWEDRPASGVHLVARGRRLALPRQQPVQQPVPSDLLQHRRSRLCRRQAPPPKGWLLAHEEEGDRGRVVLRASASNCCWQGGGAGGSCFWLLLRPHASLNAFSGDSMLELVRLNPFGCESRKTALGAVPGALPNAPFVLDRKPPFERAWGWDSLLPVNLVTSLSIYKIYLRQYYIRNHQREGNAAGADDLSLDGDDHGNGLLAALANKVAFCLAPCCPV